MYLLPNPITLTVYVRPDPDVAGNLIFSDAEAFVRCEPGRRSTAALSTNTEAKREHSDDIPLRILESTRTPDCRHVDHTAWTVTDVGPTGTGNGRVVRIGFEGTKFTTVLANARKEEDQVSRDDPRLVMRETVLQEGRVGLLIEIANRRDVRRADTLLVDLRYVLHGSK